MEESIKRYREMKLNVKSQLGLNITSAIANHIISYQYDNFIKNYRDDKMDEQELAKLKTDGLDKFLDVFSDECNNEFATKRVRRSDMPYMHNQNCLVAQTALEMAKHIKIDEDKFDVKFLSRIKDKKITFLLGSNTFIRYMKRGDEILAIKVVTGIVNRFHVNYNSFKINTATGDIVYVNCPEAPLSDPEFKFFVQLLVFTELSKLEIKILNPKEKFGTRKLGKYINESSEKVTIIDSVWNTIVVRNVGFGVSGHWRWQRCGKDFADVEYTYIEPFRKKGYIRMPKKEETTIS